MALVAHGVVDAVTLHFGTHTECIGESVLQAHTELVVRAAFAGVGVGDIDGAGSSEGIPGLCVVQANATEGRKPVGEGQDANCVEVEAFELDVSIERACRDGIGGIAKLPQIKVAALKREVAVELVPAIKFEASAAVAVRNGTGAQTTGSQTAGDSGVVNGGCGAADVGAAVPAEVVCRQRPGADRGSDSRPCRHPFDA